jgi:hypothetical protein
MCQYITIQTLKIRSLCSESFIAAADLFRHRYVVTLSHLETPVQLCSGSDSITLQEVVKCCIYLFHEKYSGHLQELCSNYECYI